MKEQDGELRELSIEKIKELLGAKKLSDEAIKKLMVRIKRFCKVAYELYLKKNKPLKPTVVIEIEKPTEENDTYKKVA